MAHEIVERNGGLDEVILVGLQTGGVPLADRIAGILAQVESVQVPVGTLDVAFYRDDIGLRPVLPEAATDITMDLTGQVVVLVDDVLFTGRTVRAALNALSDFGRARAVQLASWSTGAIASFPSGPTSSARTCRPDARRWSTSARKAC